MRVREWSKFFTSDGVLLGMKFKLLHNTRFANHFADQKSVDMLARAVVSKLSLSIQIHNPFMS